MGSARENHCRRARGRGRGHFLGCAHTPADFETAFFRSSFADDDSFEQWEAEGGQDAYRRANGKWKKARASYAAPTIDPGIEEALQAFIRECKDSMPEAFS